MTDLGQTTVPAKLTLHVGDCIEVMATMPADSVDAVVTDPPYGLGFMGKEWDRPDFMGADVPMRRNAALDAVNAGASRQGGRQRAGDDYLKRQARDARAFQSWCEAWATEALRVLKPGGHLLAFGGTRMAHRLAAGLEDAGFEVRDTIAWLYGSGFPKSLDVSKAIDKRRDWAALAELQTAIRAARSALGISQSEAARRVGMIGPDQSLGGGGFMWFETGMRVPTREQWPKIKAALGMDDALDRAFEAAEREHLGDYGEERMPGGFGDHRFAVVDRAITAPLSEAGQQWQGWGTALKPAHEPIIVARKALVGTVAGTVMAHGTGALNIDACRIGTDSTTRERTPGDFGLVNDDGWSPTPGTNGSDAGRWPANVVLDPDAAARLDEQTGELTSGANPTRRGGDTTRDTYGDFKGQQECEAARGADSGGASRFFYVAKPDDAERQAGLAVHGLFTPADAPERNDHPTVKPIDLMRWLCRLVTPPGGLVLDPFAGSGTTGCAAALEGFAFIGIEREPAYAQIARARLAHWTLGAAA